MTNDAEIAWERGFSRINKSFWLDIDFWSFRSEIGHVLQLFILILGHIKLIFSITIGKEIDYLGKWKQDKGIWSQEIYFASFQLNNTEVVFMNHF